jgi:hypothetical protein
VISLSPAVSFRCRSEEQQPENSFRSTASSYSVMIMADTKAPSLVGMEDEE